MAKTTPNRNERIEAINSGKTYSKLTSVLAIDLCGFSALMEQDEPSAIKAVNSLQKLIMSTAQNYNGRLFHSAGDGFLIEFRTTKEAFTAAQIILEKRRNNQIRAGIHVGDVSVQPDGDLLGHTVNVAVRLQQTAQPDTIMLSEQSFNLVSESDKNLVGGERQVSLKNIDENYSVRELSRRNIIDKKIKYKSRALIRTVLVTILILACGWMALDKFSNHLDDSAKQMILAEALDKYDKRNELDRRYLAHLFFELEQSKTPISELTISLVMNNKVSEAIASLERSLEELDRNDPRYSKVLHYIGALSYQTDTNKSIRTYDLIVSENPDDLQALIRLGRARDIVGESDQALNLYEKAYEFAEDAETRQWLELDIAFNHLIMGKNEIGLGIYEQLYESIGKQIEENSQLASKIYTDLGIAYERTGNHPQAISLTLEALKKQKINGHTYDLARSHTLMGYLLLNESNVIDDDDSSNLDQAIWHYSKQLEYDKKMNNFRGVSLAHISLGQIYTIKEDFKTARSFFAKSLLNTLPPQELMSYVSLAELETLEGNNERACENLLKAKNVYKTKLEANIGPKTKGKILAIKCDFSFF